AVDRAIVHVHGAVQRVDAAALGRRPVGLVGADRAARQRQHAILTADATAQGGEQGVDPVAGDLGAAESHAAAGGPEAAPIGRRPVVAGGAAGDGQHALVGDAAAGGGGVVPDVAARPRGRAEGVVGQAAAVAGGGVAADGAVGQVGRAGQREVA